ncbi:VTT domain-containing protein [Pelagicoccus sp. SDUM812005]|uniref:VTT domain-containing protein n=1 Tax=Pelagicoccus sp. SDUM812005 TaxID=3041257 RepID=UPI002810698B|nr:VTT domain-containing protein [Pelagicoccus sp. SDUM812005]MDQ8181120.1 VTT domain-containing protein [Pelagicoccus sp. SDUM812005]
MPTLNKKEGSILAVIALALLVAAAVYLAIHYELSWEQVKSSVQEAPAWIFLVSLVLLPPLGLPLSLFLFAVGARFGLVLGATVACAAIVAHHGISLYLSRFVSRFVSTNKKQEGLWQTLEKKTGGNSSKLLFLWGLLPGLPYIVKLYLPLAMGVKHSPYLRWNSAGHALGAILFVSFGNAVFQGVNAGVIIVIVVGIALSIGVKLYRDKLKRDSDEREPATNDAT